MRLLRTTTEEPSGLFNAFLNQDLVIKPYSQIALGQLSATLDSSELIVSNDNNKFTFKCLGSGLDRVVRIKNGKYDNDNSQVLIDDLIIKINNAIGTLETNGAKVTIKNGSNIGRQGRIVKNTEGKISFDFSQSKSISRFADLSKNAYVDPTVLPLAPTIIFNPSGSEATLQMKSSNVTNGTTDLTYKHSTYQNHPIASGVGVHRVRIGNLAGDNTNNAGYTIALVATDPSTFMTGSLARELAKTDIKVAIECVDPFNTGTYKVIFNGQEVTVGVPAITPNNMAGGNDNIRDVASIEIVGGNIRCVVYQNDAGGGSPHTRILYSTPYDASIPLYATYTLHGNSFIAGGAPNLSLKDIKFTPNPFDEDALDSLQPIHTDYLGAATPGGQNTAAVTVSLSFSNIEVANWFGYNNISHSQLGQSVSILANSIFQAQVINDAFMLELINLQLESYDTFQGQRKNILAFIPYNNTNNLAVNYDSGNLLFLDLNNRESINLTSLKMRLIRGDYASPDLVGTTSAILYIKESK